jgi:hypothetical protein
MNRSPAPESRQSDFERFLRHCARYWAISSNRYPRGVFKFGSIEEAPNARERQSAIFTAGETRIVERSYLSGTFKVQAFEGGPSFPFWTHSLNSPASRVGGTFNLIFDTFP